MSSNFEQCSAGDDQQAPSTLVTEVETMLRLLPYDEGLVYIDELRELVRVTDYATLSLEEQHFYGYIYHLAMQDL